MLIKKWEKKNEEKMLNSPDEAKTCAIASKLLLTFMFFT